LAIIQTSASVTKVMLGVLENAYVRPPLLPISEAERNLLREALKKVPREKTAHAIDVGKGCSCLQLVVRVF